MNPTPLTYLDGETLMSTVLPPIRFVVDKLLPQGLHILAGAPKVGKSWLALWLCLCVAKGEPVWNFPTLRGGVLYLCLEDSYSRIQNRLLDITDNAPADLCFATVSEKLHSGLEEQIEGFLGAHPDTALVVIDTLQRIRAVGNEANPYASDYRDLGVLKELADRNRIAILLIHHLRKLNDEDPMNMISGTTGISGATDTNLVLKKGKRSGSAATLYCTGRDIEYQELALEFDQDAHVWKLVSSGESTEEEQDKILASLSAFLAERRKFTGTATELAEALEPYCREKMRPNVLMKYLLRRQEELSRMGIALQSRRTRDRRELALTRACDSNDGSDGKNDTEPVPDLLSQPSQLSRSHAVSSNERRANK